MAYSPQAPGSSRFSPRALVAAAVVVLVLLIAVVLLVVSFFRGDDVPQGVAPSAVATQDTGGGGSEGDSGPAAAGAPVCPENEGSQDRIVAEAPEATWRYQDLIAYPVAPEYGPAVTDDVGRFCFQHSPTGALFMAGTAAAAGSAVSGDYGQAYLVRSLAEGPYRDQILSQGTPGYGTSDVRAAIKGFKVLDYTGDTATIDFGVDMTAQGRQAYISVIYLLTWQDGDWRLRADVEQPMTASVLPNLAGYIPWSA